MLQTFEKQTAAALILQLQTAIELRQGYRELVKVKSKHGQIYHIYRASDNLYHFAIQDGNTDLWLNGSGKAPSNWDLAFPKRNAVWSKGFCSIKDLANNLYVF